MLHTLQILRRTAFENTLRKEEYADKQYFLSFINAGSLKDGGGGILLFHCLSVCPSVTNFTCKLVPVT